MRGSWGVAVLCLAVVAAAADPPPPPVRFTLHTRGLLADVQARDAILGTPVDRPGKKLKAAYAKALALLSAEERTFDEDLDSAWKAARLLEKALPGDGNLTTLIATMTTGFGTDLKFEAGILRAGAAFWEPQPKEAILAALDPVDSVLGSAASLQDYRSASRKLRRLRKQSALAYDSTSASPNDTRDRAVGVPGRLLGAGESFEAAGTGMTFQPIGVYPAEGPMIGGTFLIGGPFVRVNDTTLSGYILYFVGTVDAPLGVPVPVDTDVSLLQVIYSPFEGSGAAAYGTVDTLSSPDLGTGTVTFSELDPATGTWAGAFDITFQSGKSLAGSFRVSGLR